MAELPVSVISHLLITVHKAASLGKLETGGKWYGLIGKELFKLGLH